MQAPAGTPPTHGIAGHTAGGDISTAGDSERLQIWTMSAAVLGGLGIPARPANLSAMVGWGLAEGGHFHNDAHHNIWNTTEPWPGATNTGVQGNIKQYKTWEDGVRATIATLKLPAYAGVRDALRHGSKSEIADAIDRSPWGTHGALLHNLIAGTDVGTNYGTVTNPNDPFDPQSVPGDIVNAAMSVPKFLGNLSVIFNREFWIRAGKVTIGVAALGYGAAIVARTFQDTLPKIPTIP